MTLRSRLILLLLLATTPLIATEIYNELNLRAERQTEIRQEAMRLTQLVDSEQNRINEGARQFLVAFAQVATIRASDMAACHDDAVNVMKQVEGYANFGVADLQGKILCSSLPRPPQAALEPDAMAVATNGADMVIGFYHRGLYTAKRIVTYSIPWRGEDGTIRGVAWIGLDLDWLAQHYANRFFSDDVTLVLADSQGTILVRQPGQSEWAGQKMDSRLIGRVHEVQDNYLDIDRGGDTGRLVAYSPIGKSTADLYVGVGINKAPYFARINAATWRKVEILAGALVLALLAIWWGGKLFIRRPVNRLLNATRRWQGGDSSPRTGLIEPRSELGELGIAFDEMATALELRQRQQKAAEEALARLNADLEQRVTTEVAARDAAQGALQQAQKVEALGRLTAGVAHDFNNLLTAIMGNLELLQNRYAPEDRAARWLAAAQRAADRGAKLTQQLLAFSRKQRIAAEPVDLNGIITGTRGLIASTIGATTRIETVLGPSLWLALGDVSQIELIILNLVINARDAMQLGGAITIESANVTLGAPERPEEPAAGDYVMLAVADTGPGMPPEVLARVFEPFFTTKEVGKGSGLGLPQVLGVTQQLGGGIRIDTRLGEGTSVKIYLPRATGAAVEVHPTPSADNAPNIIGHAVSILLVDDDSEVRTVTAGILREAGHTVIEAGSGGAAIERLERDAERVELMICDFAMPGMNGAEVARVVRRNWPRLAILFITGFADNATLMADPANKDILQKPFRGTELLERVMQIVERTHGPNTKVVDFPGRSLP